MILRLRMQVIGAFVAPVVTIVLGVAAVMIRQGRLAMPESLRSAWLPVHVTLALLGYALFVLAAGVSVVYLIYERRLKAKRALGPADNRAPSLEKLDRINYHLLGWGFLLLSLAIVSGAMWADATWGHYLVLGAAGDVVAGDLDFVCGAARIAADGGLARAAGRGADFDRL